MLVQRLRSREGLGCAAMTEDRCWRSRYGVAGGRTATPGENAEERVPRLRDWEPRVDVKKPRLLIDGAGFLVSTRFHGPGFGRLRNRFRYHPVSTPLPCGGLRGVPWCRFVSRHPRRSSSLPSRSQTVGAGSSLRARPSKVDRTWSSRPRAPSTSPRSTRARRPFTRLRIVRLVCVTTAHGGSSLDDSGSFLDETSQNHDKSRCSSGLLSRWSQVRILSGAPIDSIARWRAHSE